MPIQLHCPNGHHLTAKESNAGKTGKCPVCKAPVHIPVPERNLITDSAVMSILGEMNTQPSPRVGTTIIPSRRQTLVAAHSRRSSPDPSPSTIMPHVKLCPNCEKEIDLGYHICPYCHTYITGLNDF
jgi:ribosomal protein L32